MLQIDRYLLLRPVVSFKLRLGPRIEKSKNTPALFLPQEVLHQVLSKSNSIYFRGLPSGASNGKTKRIYIGL